MHQPEVIIVGGGFAGLAAAAALSARGARVDVLEGSATWVQQFRGELIHPRGVRALGKLGLAAPLFEAGGVEVLGFAATPSPREPVTELHYTAGVAPLLDGRVLQAGDRLLADVMASLNSSELALRRFREIARVSGLVFTGYPGAPKSTRQLQASAGLFYEVFRKYDPANRLLTQAEGEVLAQELDLAQLGRSLARMREQALDVVSLRAPSPFALALMVERFREQLTTEKLADRLARMVADAQAVLGEPAMALDAGQPPKSRSTRIRKLSGG